MRSMRLSHRIWACCTPAVPPRPARTGNRHGGLGISPYNVYATADGYVVLNAPGDQHFRSILDVIGRPDLKDDPRFATGPRVWPICSPSMNCWRRGHRRIRRTTCRGADAGRVSALRAGARTGGSHH